MYENFKKYVTRVLEVLSESFGADSKTLEFSIQKYNGNNYCNTVMVKDYITEEEIMLNFYIGYSYHDIVLCRAIDVICLFFDKNNYFDLNEIGSSFYDETKRCYLTPEGLAASIHERVQIDILRRYFSAIQIDFTNIFEISEMLYESDTANGTIAFIKSLDDELPAFLKFSMQTHPIEFIGKNLKFIRKLLAGVGNNTMLFVFDESTKNYICYGYINEGISLPFMIVLEDKNSLLFKVAGKSVFRIKNRKILCLQDELFIRIDDLKKEFGNCNWKRIPQIITSVSEQMHGTSIIFLDFNRESYNIHMENLEKNKRALACNLNLSNDSGFLSSLQDLTRMDGAIVVDINSEEIKYINVIVDGLSIATGDLSSGARHNTISCFIDNIVKGDIVENQDPSVAALIFSESGGVKLVRGSERKTELQKPSN